MRLVVGGLFALIALVGIAGLVYLPEDFYSYSVVSFSTSDTGSQSAATTAGAGGSGDDDNDTQHSASPLQFLSSRLPGWSWRNGNANDDDHSARWYDCSAEVMSDVAAKEISWTKVTSTPDPLVPGVQQVIHKEFTFTGNSTRKDLTTSMRQQYKLFNSVWVTFVYIAKVDVCTDHPGSCPLRPGEKKTLVTQHGKLMPGTPYGWYRSRQVYHAAGGDDDGKVLGCLDIQMYYTSGSAASVAASGEDEEKIVVEKRDHVVAAEVATGAEVAM